MQRGVGGEHLMCGFGRTATVTLMALLATVGSGCGGGQSGTQVQPPPPPAITVTTLVPSYAVAGGGAFTFFVDGTGFTSASVVKWNGTTVSTTFGTDQILTASIPSSLIATPGMATITVADPNSGAASNAQPFGIASPAAATAGVVQLITIATDGSPANADSLVAPSINADGRYVAFQSAATNLVPGPASGFQDIYLRDTCLGSAPSGCVPSTTRISFTSDGSPTNGHSYDSSVSGDGRFVAFDSSATNILPGTGLCGSTACVFLRDTCNGAAVGCIPNTTLVSVAVDGTTANGGSPWISSANDRFIAFDSSSTNVVNGDTNGFEDSFVRDTCFGAPSGCTPSSVIVSTSSSGVEGNSNSHGQATDAIGRFVAFQSYATNLVANDSTAPGMFLRDTCVGAQIQCVPATTRVDVSTDGTQANNGIFAPTPALTSDGRLVAFSSTATNLVATNVGGMGNIYVRDTCNGASSGCAPTTSLVSLGNDGSAGNSSSGNLGMSADGRFVAFASLASNLVPGDSETAGGFKDIFVRDTCFGVASGCNPSTVRVSVTNTPNPATQANDISDYPAISGDGHYAVFLSAATNLVPGGTNGHGMVFLAKTGF